MPDRYDVERGTIKIIGIGSPWGDDQVGWRVADAVADWVQGALPGSHLRVAVERMDRPGVRLISAMDGAIAAILVDAARGARPPGTLAILTMREWLQSGETYSSHGFGVAGALELGTALGTIPKFLRVVAVVGERFGLNDAPSAAVLAAVPQAVNAVQGLVREVSALAAAPAWP